MSDATPRTDAQKSPTYTMSASARAKLARRQARYWRQLQKCCPPQRRYAVRTQRARLRDSIRGYLVPHRTQFHIHHKSVQPGEKQATQAD